MVRVYVSSSCFQSYLSPFCNSRPFSPDWKIEIFLPLSFCHFFYLDVGHDGLVPLVPLALVASLGQLGGHDHLLVLALLALPVRQRLDPLHLGHDHLLLLHLLLHQHRPEVHPPLHGDEELELGGAGAGRGGDRAGEVSFVVRFALLQSHRDRVVLSVRVQLAPGQS